MKNFLFAVIIALVVALSANCSAYDYDHDPNYVFIVSGDVAFTYFYTPSVEVQEYNPPHYQIAGQFVRVGLLDERVEHFKVTMRYNWHTKEVFTRTIEGRWEKAHVSDEADSVLARGNARTANAMFKAAYGINFYGY